MHPIERELRLFDIERYRQWFKYARVNWRSALERGSVYSGENAAASMAYYATQLAHLARPLLEEGSYATSATSISVAVESVRRSRTGG